MIFPVAASPEVTVLCTTSFVGWPMEEGMVCFGDQAPEVIGGSGR